MKKLLALSLVLFASFAIAAQYRITTMTFDPPSSGVVPDSYNLYVDDCAVTGAVGAPIAAVTSGDQTTQSWNPVVNSDGNYTFCIRTVYQGNENPDPGPTNDAQLFELAGPIENLQIQFECVVGPCSVTVISNP